MALLSSSTPSEIAQLAEQLTVNQRVAGSSPALGAKSPRPASCGSWAFSGKGCRIRGGSSVVRAGGS